MGASDGVAAAEVKDARPRGGGDGLAGLAKGIAVLEAFAAARLPLTIAETARLTDLSRPTARRCLLTLTELGYLRFDGKRFTPTRRVLRLGSAYIGSDSLSSIAQPYLESLRDLLRETVALTVWDEGETVVVARADADRVLAVGGLLGRLGRRLPAYCTASGRVFMAAMTPEEAAAALADRQPQAHTHLTLTDPEAILRAVDEARTDGYALVDSEIELGYLVIAAPVLDSNGKTIAALSVNVTNPQVGSEKALSEFLPALLEHADRISRLT
ncbi:IclR family transcriptional regulator domain-containing protein [Catenulispora pinisilvae]|uniref:IclR family transcriptional regulator domain-containing protein n=1 Tax=Catenulispora pinisilvae TaxID=2705253 RepID=UPI001890E57F|nr:IclR family transcriptional regulator C-terminal domain-containing protein [Catenulispora pinisilvae]